MLVKEMFEIIKEEIEELLDEGYLVGVRFEEKERKEGDVITDVSRHDLYREEEREYPEYGSDDYFELPELDGVSAFEAEFFEEFVTPGFNQSEFLNDDARNAFLASRAYIIYSYEDSNKDDALDHGEIVLVEPTVHKVLF